MEHVIHSSMSIDFERRYAMDDLIEERRHEPFTRSSDT
jgi:hypothetical protein